ncbi:MAG: DUF6017 domain-containing protein, partial [Lachnospiraceae bacterium]|nr:DUF6017 domain-containing protein [Lachnospiraceae bacterium]
NNTNINNTNYSNTDFNNTDWDVCNDSFIPSLKDKQDKTNYHEEERASEGEESIHTFIEGALNCQQRIVNRTKQILEYKNGVGQRPTYDFHLSNDHQEYLDSLTYSLFLESKKKFKWNQLKTVEMARKVLDVRLEGKVLKDTKRLQYYETELYDTLVDYMANIIGLGEQLTIKGATYSPEYMGSKFFELNQELIMHVIETLRKTAGDISNKKNYYVSCLLNAKTHYTAETYGEIKMI